MAEKKTIELEIKSNLDDAEKSLGSLKSQLRNAQAEVASLSDKFGATSKEAVAAAKNAAILADKIGDAKALTDAFNPDAKFKALSGSLNGIAGGFSVVTGVMGTLGTESKDVEQAILKVQSAMAIASGAQAIGESVDQFRQLGAVVKSYAIVQKVITAGQWLWNAAMASNPIGLLVAGVAALVAGGVALTNYFMSNAEAAKINTASINANKTALNNQSKTADSASKSLQTNSDYQLAMAKASGASTDAIRKLELKLIDEKIAFANSSREIAKNTYHKNLNALASLKASDADEEQIKLQEEITRKSLEEFGKQTKNLNDANAEKGNIIRRQNVEIRQEITNHNKEVSDKNNAAADKDKEDALAKAKEKADALKAFQDEILKNQQQMNVDKINSEIQDNLDEKDRKQKSLEDISAMVDALDAEDLNKAKNVKDAKIAIAQKEKEGRIQAADAAANTLSGLSELLGKETAAGKAAAVASATINTFSSAQKAYDSTVGIPIVGPVLAPINAGIAIAAGIKNVKSILAVKTPGGGGGSAPSISGGGGGTTPAAPSFNVVGASSTNQLAQTIGNQQQQPIKAYVVSNDVTTAQSLDRNIIQSASIG